MPSTSNDQMEGLVREAMALRVKYRLKFTGRIKRPAHICMLCVHKDNRGGQYPQAGTVENLGVHILTEGFNAEEANHEGVCVQELPANERSAGYVTSFEWNCMQCQGTALEGCFTPDGADVALGTLSHSHLLLTLLCWHNGLKWNVPLDDKGIPKGKWAKVIDRDGCLMSDAVASADSGYAEVLKEGLVMETLSWKIQTEEPLGCSKISQALNKGHQLGLKTHELTAIRVLNGTIGMQLEKQLANEVSFDTVKELVRAELDMWVDDADFIELFEFILNQGGSKNTYMTQLLEFGEKFVDPKQRQLRLAAFQTVNKLPVWAPRTKNAIIMRAYRKPPSNTYCPLPEAFWRSSADADIEKLEQILLFYQKTCKYVLDKNTAVAAMAFQSNVAIAAVDAYITRHSKKDKMPTCILVATKPYYEKLAGMVKQFFPPGSPLPKPTDNMLWIDYEDAAVVARVKANEKKNNQRSSPLTLQEAACRASWCTTKRGLRRKAQNKPPLWSINQNLKNSGLPCHGPNGPEAHWPGKWGQRALTSELLSRLCTESSGPSTSQRSPCW